MIPVYLELEAFGPFAELQKIDFTVFDNDRIFLIHGRTGSGKTTIFDAITFCLFGEPSGTVRDSDSFKSGFASEAQVCYAEFRFIVHGITYTVRREPIQLRLKRNGNLTRENASATLTYEDGEIFSGAKVVTAKIEEILGINADQFKKIVMLPQGEFRRFLSDDAEEKQKILRKIFSTSVLEEFTAKLREQVFEIEMSVKQLDSRCQALLDALNPLPNTALSEELSSQPRNIGRILSLLFDDNKLLDENRKLLQTQLKNIREKKEKLQLPMAKQLNSEFEALNESRTALKALETKADYYAEMEKGLRQADGLKAVLQAKKAYDQADSLLLELVAFKETAKLREEKEQLSSQLDALLKLRKNLNNCGKLTEIFQKQAELYKTVTIRFINSQAFLLSANLQPGSPCPVCGSTEHPMPAQKNSETVTQAEFEGQKLLYEESAQALKEAKTIFLQALEAYGFDKSAHERLSEFFIDIDFAENGIKTKFAKLNEDIAAITSTFPKNLPQNDKRSFSALQALCDSAKLDAEEKKAELNYQLELLKTDVSQLPKIAERVAAMPELSKQLETYKNELTKYKAITEQLSQKLANSTPVDIKALQSENLALTEQESIFEKEYSSAIGRLKVNRELYEQLSKTNEAFVKKEQVHRLRSKLYDVASGKMSDRVNFERYVLAAFFEDVIENANLRLEKMTNSRYTLYRRDAREKGTKASGLSMEVFDAYTGQTRHMNTMSGGETFKIALCLSLGLADIISQNAGGVELNTLFIDEGFGSLDSASLDTAIECLYELKSSGRYVSIISHVSELKEKIPSGISVIQTPQGSCIEQ